MSLNQKIIELAVSRNNGRDYGSLQDAIKHFHILDDEATALFDELLPEFLEAINNTEGTNYGNE